MILMDGVGLTTAQINNSKMYTQIKYKPPMIPVLIALEI